MKRIMLLGGSGALGSCEFAWDFRKIAAICRADVGIGPYKALYEWCRKF